jgi:hypothetical protein
MLSRRTLVFPCLALTATVSWAPTRAAGAPRAPLTNGDAAAVERARKGAVRLLADAECRKIFSEFHDAHGRTIETSLEEWALDPADYLRIVPFVDGTGEPVCHRTDVMLVSTPNVPRIIVCPGFARVERLRPEEGAIMVIHEELHTLGLGENPPTSAEISRRVRGRCR